MNKINAVIIDDEVHGQLCLQQLLNDYCLNINIVGIGEDVKSGIEIINQTKPDLVFLDISMPDGEGFEVLEQTQHLNFKTIFVTAHNEYAIKAFEYSAIHYLLKPINIKHLINAVNRVERINKINIDTINFLKQQQNSHSEKIVLDTSRDKQVFSIDEISHFESNGKYAFLYDSQGEKTFISKSMRELEQLFQDHAFFRIHRSFFIQISEVVIVTTEKDYKVLMKNGYELPISVRKLSSFKNVLADL